MIEQEFHAAISAEKPVAPPITPALLALHDQPVPAAGHKLRTSKTPEKKAFDAERGESRKRLSAVSTQVVAEINDVEILETTFGVSFVKFLSVCC